MIKINYIQPEQTESPDDICIHNLRISDKFKNLTTFSQSSVAWLKNDPNRNYQDLEILLRNLDLDTHLIAKPFDKLKETNLILSLPNRTTETNELDYVLLISCRNKYDALKELENYHMSYEDNLNCLKKTGTLTNPNIKIDDFSNKEFENEKKILNSELKYDFKIMDGKESIQVIIEDLIKKNNSQPEIIVCGKFGDKNVYAIMFNNEIASPIGWIEEDDDYKLIDFRNIKRV